MARYVLIAVAAVFLAGCTFAESHARLAYGSFEFNQGRYERARQLFEEIPAADARDDGELEALREYNLGAVDYAAGNLENALERWNGVNAAGSNEEVIYRARFNSGVLHFEQGRYEEAYRSFREALTVFTERERAKRNLELAFERWRRAGGAEAAGSVTEQPDSDLDEEAERLLQQLRDMERQRRELRDEFVPAETIDDW
ncbi:MAG: tetratricopeptide repeat protein [Spirochaetia bacterium]